ncbi:MAG: glycosyltransferase, partial [Clostridia bacterium]|nr:glycosyltransferase [Clostridia bacterium]
DRAEEIKAENADKIICYAMGRHVPYKGIEYLVRASKLLDDKFSVYIGGQGPLTESLKELAQGDDKVHFLGRVSDEEATAYMLACDIFCFPSITKNEAFGIALAEAMYFSNPAVTFTIDGSGVYYVSLDGVTGIEAENGNVEKYAQALQTLAKDESLRQKYGEAAKQRVLDNFTFEKFKENVNSLLETI